MLIPRATPGPRYSEITPREVYLNRRRFLGQGRFLGMAALATLVAREATAGKLTGYSQSGPYRNLTNEQPSPQKTITGYNNFYEFGTGKTEPAENAPAWKPNPEWPVRLEGEVAKAKTLGLDAILKIAPLEERIYRLRCVEHWSLVVPWIGIPLSALLKQVEPNGKAKYVAFESYYDPKVMISSSRARIQFPYVEGLRLDEAMHPLAFLAVGVYGETLPNQCGAPIRLVVPWKYGFKSIKSIARIRLVEKQPPTTWNLSWSEAYGFYSNVNPNKAHPGWSQRFETRLGGGFLGSGTDRGTQMFNGYGEQVAGLYQGMDLIKNY